MKLTNNPAENYQRGAVKWGDCVAASVICVLMRGPTRARPAPSRPRRLFPDTRRAPCLAGRNRAGLNSHGWRIDARLGASRRLQASRDQPGRGQ